MIVEPAPAAPPTAPTAAYKRTAGYGLPARFDDVFAPSPGLPSPSWCGGDFVPASLPLEGEPSPASRQMVAACAAAAAAEAAMFEAGAGCEAADAYANATLRAVHGPSQSLGGALSFTSASEASTKLVCDQGAAASSATQQALLRGAMAHARTAHLRPPAQSVINYGYVERPPPRKASALTAHELRDP